MEDIIIIGGGPVGIYASTLASLHGLKGLLIEGLHTLGGQLTSLYPEKDIVDLPGFFKITAQEFVDELIKQQNSLSNPLPIKLNEQVINFIKEEEHFIVKTTIQEYKTKTLLFATGMGVFKPRPIGLENEGEFSNIIYSLTEKELLRDKKVIILGGGDSGVDWANNLTGTASKVSLIHRREDFRAKESAVNKMYENGVNIYKSCTVSSLNGENSVLKSITVTNNKGDAQILDLDYLFVNYGVITSLNTFNLDNDKNSFIVQSDMSTSLKGVFAIGNACTYLGKVKNIASGLGEASTAIMQIDTLLNPNKHIPSHF